MKTNDLKKGARVRLANGWEADIADNAKGNIRMAKVYGFETEIGSVYSHDITHFKAPSQLGGESLWYPIEHTPAQIKLRRVAAF